MRHFEKSNKLKNVCYDIRGPVMDEANRMMAQGETILRLNIGNPAPFGFRSPDAIIEHMAKNLTETEGYSDSKGLIEARRAIVRYCNERGMPNVTEEDVYTGNGVSELVTMALNVFLNTGDELLMPAPSYSLWSNSAYLAGGKPVFYRCDEENHWYPDLDDLRSKITSRTRGMVIINPNNPTGAVYPREVLEEMIKIARENDLVIFSDEIYDRLLMDGVEHISPASLAPDLFTVTFNGLSKSHVICGFRCAWMIFSGRKDWAQDYMEGIFQLAAMRLCSTTLPQLAIPAALKDTESTRAMMRPGGRLYEQSEATMRELAKIEGISCVKNNAAFYVFPKLDIKKFNISSDKKFAFDLLHQKHILIVPGSGFDWTTPDHFRIVMLPDAERMAQAIRDIGDFLKDYRQ